MISNNVATMNFSELVSLVNEPNTPSGAHESIRIILRELPTNRIQRILDVGCNTGFATLEFASWSTANVTGLDSNEQSLEWARAKSDALGYDNTRFVHGNLLEMPFEDSTFDLVYCNNVTSFVSERERAADEYCRVLRPGGVIAAVPIFSLKSPPDGLLARVSAAIDAPVIERGKQQWLDCFAHQDLSLIYQQDFIYNELDANYIEDYARHVTSRERLPHLDEMTRAAACARLNDMYTLFEENLRYAAFSVMLFRYRGPNGSEILHTSRPLQNLS